MKFSKIIALFLSLALILPLAGCAGKHPGSDFNASYYPQCYDPIAKLCKDQDNSAEIKSAAVGGLIGALGGAIIGGLASGKVEGALAGAAVGAVAGGTIGFFKGRLDKIKDREQRLAEYQKMLGESSKSWDLERASVEKAYRCYREQIKALKVQVKAKSISKEEFLARMGEIEQGIENINTYWADSKNRMDARVADGEAFLNEQAEQDKLAEKTKKKQKSLQASRKQTDKLKNQVKNGQAATDAEQQLAVAELEAFKAEYNITQQLTMLDNTNA